jgi:hypothetical protein
MVTTELKMALWRRGQANHRVADGLTHHSDGSEYIYRVRGNPCAGRDRPEINR